MGQHFESVFETSEGSEHQFSASQSDDGSHSTTYKVPMRVKNNFAFPDLLVPVCVEIIEHLSNSKINFVDRSLLIDANLKKFVENLTYDQLYYAVVDYMLWTRTLDKLCHRKAIERSNLTWTVKRLLQLFDEEIKNNRDPELVKNAIVEQLEIRKINFYDLYEVIATTKCYEQITINFGTKRFIQNFLAYLFHKKLESDTKTVFLWYLNLNAFKRLRNFPIEKFVYYALVKKETSGLMKMCEADESKKMAISVVTFLDKIVGSFYIYIDPDYVPLDLTDETKELKTREKELVKMALKYFKTFNLDKSLVKNSIFDRQIRAFTSCFKEFNNSPKTAKNEDIFYQKAMHIAKEGGKRAQSAILTYLWNSNATNHALMLALRMDLPVNDWPIALSYRDEVINAAKQQLAEWRKKLQESQEKIKNGFNLLNKQVHIVRLVDSAEKVDLLLRPFIANSTFFGYDSEWDMSYHGEQGDLCLIQISNEIETLLIDIHTFKNTLNWSNEQFMELFKLLFDHSKPIYGFAFSQDLSVIGHNFPSFNTEILTKLSNLFCMHEAAKRIHADVGGLCNAVFGDEPPEQLNLAALTKHVLGFSLEKEEQSSVWGGLRPLRHDQQKYAAKDSYILVQLKKALYNAINKTLPDKLDSVFVPWTSQSAVDPDFAIDPTKKTKTRCNQFTEEELKDLVREINELLSLSESQNTPDEHIYITDTMCAPLGHCLRRLGISVLNAADDNDVNEKANLHPKSKILTTGKAVKKYPFGNRVININVSFPLDHQLKLFLKNEKLQVNPDDIKPRCIRCNEHEMVYVPALCLRYLHCRFAITKCIDVGIEVDILQELEKKMAELNTKTHPPQHYFVLNRGESGLIALFPNAVIYLEHNYMHQLKKGYITNSESSIKLHLSIGHCKDESKYDEKQLYGICHNCGKENLECTLLL